MRNRISNAVTVLVLFIGIAGVFRGHLRRNTSRPAVETAVDIRRTEPDWGDLLELRQENDETPCGDGGSRTDAAALGNRDGHRTIIERSTTSSPGGIVENARVVYKQISTEILVSV